MKPFIIYLLLLSIASCSWDLNDPSKAWYYPRAGSTLTLHQRLTLNPDTAALYIQHGKITGSKHSRFDPYCKIRVRNPKHTRQYINPDTFTITHSGRHTQFVASLTGFSLPLGNNTSPAIHWHVSGSDGPSDITETIQMGLTSVKQPEVLYLVCGGVENHPADAEPPTYAEIKEALGKIMSLNIHSKY